MKRPFCAALGALLLAVAGAAPAAPQTALSPAPAATSALPHIDVTAAALAGLPRRTITVTEDGANVSYSGVDLGALLAKNGAPQGPALRGPAAADYAVLRASDGYRTVFALAELDPGMSDKVVLLADRRNDAPLDVKLGPFRAIVPDEKHHLRWIRNVVSIDVVNAP